MGYGVPFQEAVRLAEHYLALGQTEVFVQAETAPWHLATQIKAGGCYRFNAPINAYVTAQHESGLTLKWEIEFEHRSESGTGSSNVDRAQLREAMIRLPESVRLQFADILESEVLPDMQVRTDEIRASLNRQLDSEECVRGLVAFVREKCGAKP
jgi:hypothetical protein